jgi:hypothetical protein
MRDEGLQVRVEGHAVAEVVRRTGWRRERMVLRVDLPGGVDLVAQDRVLPVGLDPDV